MKKVSLLMVIKKSTPNSLIEEQLSNRYWSEFAEIHRSKGRLREKHTSKQAISEKSLALSLALVRS